MTTTDGSALERIWAKVLADPREALERTLSPTDLQTLLLAVARGRAGRRTPHDLVDRWHEDAYVRPAASDPRAVSRVEAQLWRLLPEAFTGIELSPVTPLGTSTAVGPVDQNRVLSCVRNVEVVSDLTNALALEAAARRRGGTTRAVHLAACHRVLRLQRFPAPASQHFRLFALVSTTRDKGGGRAEADLLVQHLAFWTSALAEIAPDVAFRVEVTAFDAAVMRERLADAVIPALLPVPDHVTVETDAARERGRGYYSTAALRIVADDGRSPVEIGDGGLTTWTAQLLADAKERCLISCISTERLTRLLAAH